MIELKVEGEKSGIRLDVFLSSLPPVGSRSRAATLIDQGRVTVDGKERPRSYRLKPGQVVRLDLAQSAYEPGSALVAEDIPVTVVYEDEWLMVVDKPAGLVVHPARGHSSGTLVNALLGRGLAGGEPLRPGIVHRLDKDTSGLMLVTKDESVHRHLSNLIRERVVKRVYLALVHGVPPSSGTIEAPIGRHVRDRTRMTIGGVAPRPAVTHFRVLEQIGEFALVEARLETGRTHQIRVHFNAIGHSVCGDPVYARRDPLGIGRQFLHSYVLAFTHPVTGEDLEFRSELPSDLQAVLSRLRSLDSPSSDQLGKVG